MGMGIVTVMGMGMEGMGIDCMGMVGNGNFKKPFPHISSIYM